jgi:hypothetical protein
MADDEVTDEQLDAMLSKAHAGMLPALEKGLDLDAGLARITGQDPRVPLYDARQALALALFNAELVSELSDAFTLADRVRRLLEATGWTVSARDREG